MKASASLLMKTRITSAIAHPITLEKIVRKVIPETFYFIINDDKMNKFVKILIAKTKSYTFTIRNDLSVKLFLYLNESNNLLDRVEINPGENRVTHTNRSRKYVLLNEDETYRVEFEIGYKAFMKQDVAVAASVLQDFYAPSN